MLNLHDYIKRIKCVWNGCSCRQQYLRFVKKALNLFLLRKVTENRDKINCAVYVQLSMITKNREIQYLFLWLFFLKVCISNQNNYLFLCDSNLQPSTQHANLWTT